MSDPVPLDDTSANYKQFESELLARDRDATRLATAVIDVATAPLMDLVDVDIVTPVPEDRVVVHEPSCTTFDSIIQRAVFNRGWMTAFDIDEKDE